MFALVYWFNLQVLKRRHSLKIFERDETRVVQLLLLKPLYQSHSPVKSTVYREFMLMNSV